MNPHIFREYDIRGLVEKDLTDEVAESLGLALGTRVLRAGGKRVVVGRDCRESSPRLRDALARGLLATGCDVLDIGVVPTPLTYFAANTLPVDGLAMITGSHNPPEYNGFKLGVGKATFFGEEIQALSAQIERKDFERGQGTKRDWDIVTHYLDFVCQDIKVGPRKMKLVVDAGNGVGGSVAVPMLRRLGFEVIPLYCEMDGRFPNHHADPTVAENLRDLIATVQSERADLGIAYDGDADRIGVVDDTGRILWGDELTILLARDVLSRLPGAAIIGEVKCSMRMYDAIREAGGRPIMWKAGHSLIKAKMKEEHAALAGEMSGHIFWKDRYYGFDDAAYTTARLLEILTATDEKLSTIMARLPKTCSTPELRVDTEEEKKFEIVRRLTAYWKDEAKRRTSGPDRVVEVIDVDGVRVVFPDGWGLVRSSNTQPILVTRFEATSEERLTSIRSELERVLAEVMRALG